MHSQAHPAPTTCAWLVSETDGSCAAASRAHPRIGARIPHPSKKTQRRADACEQEGEQAAFPGIEAVFTVLRGSHGAPRGFVAQDQRSSPHRPPRPVTLTLLGCWPGPGWCQHGVCGCKHHHMSGLFGRFLGVVGRATPATAGVPAQAAGPAFPTHAQGRSKKKTMTVHLAKGENRLRRETPFNYRVQFRNDLPPVRAGWGCLPWKAAVTDSWQDGTRRSFGRFCSGERLTSCLSGE